MGFIEGFKQGYSGDTSGDAFSIAGKRVTCPHCEAANFEEGTALLNTLGLTFLGLDWANREAHLLICTRCSSVQWFLEEPKQLGRE